MIIPLYESMALHYDCIPGIVSCVRNLLYLVEAFWSINHCALTFKV